VRREAEGRIASRLAKKRYEIGVDLSFREQLDARVFLQASGAETRVGWMRRGETLEKAGLAHGTADMRSEGVAHWSRYTAQPLACFGVDAPDFELTWRITKQMRARAEMLWKAAREKKRGASKLPRVALIPGGSEERRRHVGRFVAVGKWAAERGASIVVAGAPGESKLIRGVCKSIGASARPYTGKDLGLLAAIVTAADVVVTNDTGPMHIAFLMGIPTIAVFNYMSPIVWGPPWNTPRFVVLNASHASEGAKEVVDVWARLAIHHLEGMLARCAR
jgi:ADP-heptose:LPS heptosyltransferase